MQQGKNHQNQQIQIDENPTNNNKKTTVRNAQKNQQKKQKHHKMNCAVPHCERPKRETQKQPNCDSDYPLKSGQQHRQNLQNNLNMQI